MPFIENPELKPREIKANITTIGTSITAGFTQPESSWPTQLSKVLDEKYFDKNNIHNLAAGATGINYSLSKQALSGYEAVINPDLLNIAVIEHGTNNIVSFAPDFMSFNDFKEKYKLLISKLKLMGYQTVIVIAEGQGYYKHKESFRAFYNLRNWLKDNYKMIGADYFASIWDDSMLGYRMPDGSNAKYWVDDVHYSPIGSKRIAEVIMKPVLEYAQSGQEYWQNPQ